MKFEIVIVWFLKCLKNKKLDQYKSGKMKICSKFV
jgi:hypothetical protein